MLLATAACSGDIDQTEINALLDARDQAISRQDLGAYSSTLISNYHDRDQTKVVVVAHIIDVFEQFESTRMQSRHRRIQLIDASQAECNQSYTLSVKADGKWRKITGRERLYLKKTPAGWRISGGL